MNGEVLQAAGRRRASRLGVHMVEAERVPKKARTSSAARLKTMAWTPLIMAVLSSVQRPMPGHHHTGAERRGPRSSDSSARSSGARSATTTLSSSGGLRLRRARQRRDPDGKFHREPAPQEKRDQRRDPAVRRRRRPRLATKPSMPGAAPAANGNPRRRACSTMPAITRMSMDPATPEWVQGVVGGASIP